MKINSLLERRIKRMGCILGILYLLFSSAVALAVIGVVGFLLTIGLNFVIQYYWVIIILIILLIILGVGE